MPKITPQNVVDFMSKNVVTIPSLGSASPPYADSGKKLVWACLISSAPAAILTNNNGGGVYYLKFLKPEEADGNDDAFLTYWVEYEEDGPGTHTWLGREAPLMFTAMMTGCTFGLGSYTDGGVRAAHVNSLSASVTKQPDGPQISDQHQKLVNLGLTTREIPITTYLPNAFDPTMKTTPFGFRPVLSGGVAPFGKGAILTPSLTLPWKFLWLKYKQQGRTFTHMGVKQHAGGHF